MKNLNKTLKFLVAGSCLVASSGIALAQHSSQEKIKVQVQLQAPKDANIRAVGFSVGKSSTGSLGRMTTKSGPANAMYSFGLRKKNGEDVPCGKAKLTKNSIVKLTYDGKKCKVHKVVGMKLN